MNGCQLGSAGELSEYVDMEEMVKLGSNFLQKVSLLLA